MQIQVNILSVEESWKHQLNIYETYHKKYSNIYPTANFFYHPYLLEKFSQPNLSPTEINKVECYFKNKIYNKKHLENTKNIIIDEVIPFIINKNEILKQLPIKHPSSLTINLSGAMSGGSYNAKNNYIKLSPQCVTKNFLPFLMVHEFTHICVEDDIQKYKLPHIAKERLVSNICSQLLGFDDHNIIQDQQLDKLITKNDLLTNYFSVLSNLQKLCSSNSQTLPKPNNRNGCR